MKNFIIFGLLALSVAVSSCGKTYQCDCPAGQSVSVVAKDEADVPAKCEAQSAGRCSY